MPFGLDLNNSLEKYWDMVSRNVYPEVIETYDKSSFFNFAPLVSHQLVSALQFENTPDELINYYQTLVTIIEGERREIL